MHKFLRGLVGEEEGAGGGESADEGGAQSVV